MIYRIGQLIQGISAEVHKVGVYVLFIMMLLTAVDVAGRYLFNHPVLGSYELIQVMMAVVVFFCIAHTQVVKSHVSIDILVVRLPEKVRAIIESITLLIGLGLFSVIAWRAVVYGNSLRLADVTTELLKVPIYPFVWVVAFGSMLLCLVLMVDLRDSIARLRGGPLWNWLWFSLGLALVLSLSVIAIWGQQLWQPSVNTIAIIGIGIMLLFMFLGMPIAFAMGIAGFLGTVYICGIDTGLAVVGMTPFSQAATYTMSVAPLFILMGLFVSYSGLSQGLYESAYKWFGRVPGGLAISTVAACGGFAAVSGDSLSSAATMGTVSFPQMKRYNYNEGLAAASIAAGGTLGILIPPSVPLIIYAMLVEESVGKLFIAGMIPGIIQVVIFSAIIFILCKFNPQLGPKGMSSSFKEKLVSLVGIWPTLLLFLVVVGGIYLGVFTSNEAGGIGAACIFIILLASKKFNSKMFMSCLIEAGKITAMILTIFFCAMLFNYFLTITNLPFNMAAWITDVVGNRYIIMLLMIAVYAILGCFMSVMGMMLITVPIFYPIALAVGFDTIWFGILVMMVMELAMITPPYGINAYVVHSVVRVPLGAMFKGIIPFIIGDIVLIVLLLFVPQIATFLPSVMK